jgi:hypothetical protein
MTEVDKLMKHLKLGDDCKANSLPYARIMKHIRLGERCKPASNE